MRILRGDERADIVLAAAWLPSPVLGRLGFIAKLEETYVVVEHLRTRSRKRSNALLDSRRMRFIDVLATDYKIDGAAELVCDLPSSGQRNAAVGSIPCALVTGVGGAGNTKRLCEILGRTIASHAAKSLQRPFATK